MNVLSDEFCIASATILPINFHFDTFSYVPRRAHDHMTHYFNSLGRPSLQVDFYFSSGYHLNTENTKEYFAISIELCSTGSKY